MARHREQEQVSDRDNRGRLHDGDRVQVPGRDRWSDTLPAQPVLDEPTQLLPLVEPSAAIVRPYVQAVANVVRHGWFIATGRQWVDQ